MSNKNHDDAINQENDAIDGLPDIEDVATDASEKTKSKKKPQVAKKRKSLGTKKSKKKKIEKKKKKNHSTDAQDKKEEKNGDEESTEENEIGTVVPLTELNEDPEEVFETSDVLKKDEASTEKEHEALSSSEPDVDDDSLEMLDFEEDDEEENTEPKDVADQFAAHAIEKPSKKKSAHDQSIDDRLASIYENPDGSMPDMTTFQGKTKWRFLKAVATLALACALLAAVVWLGFFVLEPKGNFSEEDVILSISGQDVVQVGETVRYRIRYRNAQKVSLKDVSLRVRYPNGFIFETSSEAPSSESNDVWNLGELKGGESGYIDIDGRLFGSAEQEQSLRAFLSYEPDNFSSEFQKVDTVITRIDNISVAMEITGNKEVLPGAETALTITFDPTAVQGLSELALRLVNPEQFVVRSSSAGAHPTLPNTWIISLAEMSSGTKSLNVTGVFTALEDPNAMVAAQFQIVGWVEGKNNNEGYILAERNHEVVLLSQEVLPTLVINGSTTDLTVQPGETLSVSAVLKNAGDKALEKVQARIVFDTPSNSTRKSLLRWADLNDDLEGRIVGEQLTNEKRRGSIVWTSTEVPVFASFAAGMEHVIDLTIPIKTANDEDLASFANKPITALFEITYDGVEGKEIISTVPITLTVNSDTTLTVRDAIDQNDQGKNIHTVTLLIQNTFHDLADIHIETDLYGDITWLEDILQVPAGEVVFDEKTKKLTWKVDVMPVSVDVLALQFGILLNTENPTQTNLSSKINFKATDTVTGKPIIKIGDELLLQILQLSE